MMGPAAATKAPRNFQVRRGVSKFVALDSGLEDSECD